MKLIDADTVRDDFANTIYLECADDKDNNRANRIITAFDDLPTIEAEPVRHGKWKRLTKSKIARYCSLCGTRHVSGSANNFCPKCGAKMEGGEDG